MFLASRLRRLLSWRQAFITTSALALASLTMHGLYDYGLRLLE